MEYKLPVLVGSSGSQDTWNQQAVINNNYIIPTYTNPEWSHAFIIVGWDDTKGCWEMENSWGAEWGKSGRAYIPYNYKGLFNEAYGAYDLPNYWKTMNNVWKQLSVIEAAWTWLTKIGHPPINEVDKNIHMKSKSPTEFYIGLLGVIDEFINFVGPDKVAEFKKFKGWK